MKVLAFIALICLAACGKDSSPEGRMSMKVDEIHQQIDSLKHQNTRMMDSLASISRQLNDLKKK